MKITCRDCGAVFTLTEDADGKIQYSSEYKKSPASGSRSAKSSPSSTGDDADGKESIFDKVGRFLADKGEFAKEVEITDDD